MSVLPQQDPTLTRDPGASNTREDYTDREDRTDRTDHTDLTDRPYRQVPDPSHTLPPAGPGATRIEDPQHLLPAHASGAEPGRGGPWRLIMVVLVLLAATAFVVWRVRSNQKEALGQANRAAAAANRPIPVQVVPVQQRTVPVFLTALGTVTAYNTVTLHSRVDGQLLQVNFREGQAVKKGQLLLQIDPRPYQASVDQALGTLAKDEATLKNTEAEAQRYTALYQAGVVSKESQQLQVSNQGQAAGTMKVDQAAIEAARVNLGYTRIYSPIEGIVGLRQIDPGNIVHAADAAGLVVITQVHPIAVIFTLPEDQLPQVQQAMRGGKPLVVEAYDRTDAHRIASGTLLTIDNQIDTTTGTAKLKAVFDNQDGSLFSNQFVNVRLILRDRPSAIVVPTAAIESGNQGDYVFVVNPGPTPANKRKNLPNGGADNAAAPSAGSHRKGSGAEGTPAEDTTDEEAAPGGHGGETGRSRAQFHADSVPVNVDFTIGTISVLAEGSVHAGQQVVVDGQEKLVDGGNVSPQQARSVPAVSSTTPAGAGAGPVSAAPGSARGATTGSQSNRGGQTSGLNGSPAGAANGSPAGSSNGGGRP